jgi:hypothetical protein
MRQATLLPLNNMNICNNTPEHPTLDQIMLQCIQLELENTLNNVRPVIGRLTWAQFDQYLGPLWLLVMVTNRSGLPCLRTKAMASWYSWCMCHGPPVKVAGRMVKCPTLATLSCINPSTAPSVKINTQLLLVLLNIAQSLGLYLAVLVNAPLLKQPATMSDQAAIIRCGAVMQPKSGPLHCGESIP